MRLVVQRVTEARVTVGDSTVGAIGPGLLVLVGIGPADTLAAVTALAQKVATLRVFADAAGKMNRAVRESGGAVLVVSQFTLYAELVKGSRPSFHRAAPPEVAAPLITAFAQALRDMGISVAEGHFGAAMQVALVNDGPVTIIIDG
jgi:D-tyrosyl-tRNA(Tyr) deacylase